MLKRGELVIMNDVDCPEAKLVAVLTRFDDKTGVWHARYLAKATARTKCWSSGNLGGPTPISDFGKSIEWDKNRFRIIDTGAPTKAAYRDGKPRQWQDYSSKHWHEADKVSMQKLPELVL